MMDPEAQAVANFLRAQAVPMPADTAAWLATYRAALETVVAMQGPAPPTIVRETTFPVAGERLPLRLYRPSPAGPWPTLLFLHGGGFVGGTLEAYDIPLRWLARRSGWQIAAPAYRLAPDHPFPAAPDDCMAALRHIRDDAAIDADPGRIAVGGDSAGGLLATVVARRARDAGWALSLQILLYPNTDLREEAPYASRQACNGIVIRVDELFRSLALYLGTTDRTRPDVSPILATDLAGLCPALLVTNEYDPLRDEGEVYGERLRTAGVPITMRREAGMIHTALQRAARIGRGDALISAVAETLRALGPT